MLNKSLLLSVDNMTFLLLEEKICVIRIDKLDKRPISVATELYPKKKKINIKNVGLKTFKQWFIKIVPVIKRNLI